MAGISLDIALTFLLDRLRTAAQISRSPHKKAVTPSLPWHAYTPLLVVLGGVGQWFAFEGCHEIETAACRLVDVTSRIRVRAILG
jgi:hypothetical protein